MQAEGTAEQITALYNALIEAQAEFPSIPKTKNAYNYKYAPLPEIHLLIRPILIRHGLGVIHPISRIDGKQSVGTALVHSGGGRLSCDGLAIPETAKIQEQGGYVTYGSRYGYCSMLGLTSEDDDDAAFASASKSPRKPQARRDGVAQVGRAPLPTPVLQAPSGDSGPIPDPSLPSKEERADYVQILKGYEQHVDAKDLQAYVLSQSGASEGRLIKNAQWKEILSRLRTAFQHESAEGLRKLVGGTTQ